MKTQVLIQFCLLSVLISGCSAKKNLIAEASDAKTNDAPQSIVVERTLSNGDQVISTAPVSTESWESQPKMSWAGTTIVEMHDGFGNKVEHRAFTGDSPVSLVVVRTPGRGEQSIEIHGRNGELRKLPIDKINLALQGTGDEIAAIVGITKTATDSQSNDEKEQQTILESATQNVAPPASKPNKTENKQEQFQNNLKQISSQSLTEANPKQNDKAEGVN